MTFVMDRATTTAAPTRKKPPEPEITPVQRAIDAIIVESGCKPKEAQRMMADLADIAKQFIADREGGFPADERWLWHLSNEMVKIFREVKQIFDPEDIFNPHKKMDADWKYSAAHIRRS